MVSRASCVCVVVGRGGGLQIRRGEARRYAGFEALWGPACTPVSLAAAVGRLARSWDSGPCPSPAPANGMHPLRPQAPSPAAGFKPKWECYAAVWVCGREAPPPLHPASLQPSLPLPLSLSRPIPAVWQSLCGSLAVWQP